ncbi:threonylcarbamoyl-AMP synthase [Naumannella sp. ID2617S]|nr:threonylcarbamoyl-AMP synthase [Naumannella sp. ID2617S]
MTEQEQGPPAPEPSEPAYRRFDCTDSDQRAEALVAAKGAVDAGECVVLPTDTVYGIGANSFSAAAVQRLLDSKGRGRDMPPPVLIADPAVMMALGRDIPEAAKKLAEQHWPGPLTIIVYAQSSLQMDLGETRGTIALRVPDHELARELLQTTGPLAVSSANRTGQPAATDADAAIEQLGDRVAVYLDGGATPGPMPSTIVDFTHSDYGAVVRHGRIDIAELRATVPYLDDRTEPDIEAG